MAVDIRFIIDGEDRGQPLNPEDFGVNINEDDSIGARIVSFENNLIFGGDVYGYFFDKLRENGYCGLVSVRVDYLCGKVWQKLVDGFFIVTEAQFEYDKCQVSLKLYDQTFSTRINNNKSIPFSMNVTTTKNGQSVTPPTTRALDMFNPADGTYDSGGRAVLVYDAFAHLIACMSDNLVGFESNFFSANVGDTDIDVLTNGANIRTGVATEIVISFEELFNALRSKLNIGMGFEISTTGRPVLRIEPVSYFYQSTASANLYNQSGIQMSFDRDRLYASVKFGNDPVLEQNECGDGSQPCTFAQTPFRGFRNESFGFSGECNTNVDLQLETQKVIFDTNAIENIYRFGETSYDLNNVIVQSDWVTGVGPNLFIASKTDPYSIGQHVYNGKYTNLNVSTNWIQGYPNSLYSFLEQGFAPPDTNFFVRVSNTPLQQFFTNNTTGTYFSEFLGIFIQFDTEVSDPNNLFSGSDYVVPYAGIYTFNAQIIRQPVGDPIVGNIEIFAVVKHFDGGDNFIAQYNGSAVVQNESSFSLCSVAASFVCNQGDIVRVDLYAKSQNGTNVPIKIADDFGGQFSEFYGNGIPIQSPELEPVNIEDVRAYLYKFNRPLTMAEISSIIGNTSNPIQFGRKNDPLSVIEGFIKTVQVGSILRKNAEFTLKSNQLLQ